MSLLIFKKEKDLMSRLSSTGGQDSHHPRPIAYRVSSSLRSFLNPSDWSL